MVSLEEVPGTDEAKLSDDYFWTMYDDQTPGMKDWVTISNPGNKSVYYEITVGGQDPGPGSSGIIGAGASVAPDFPGKKGGPIELRAWTDDSKSAAAKVIAFQRVLSNSGRAFNEVLGMPAGDLTGDYLWTRYDQNGSGFADWVLVANPSASDDVYYQIKVTGSVQATGSIGPGQNVAPAFPGLIGGPVEVRSCSAAFDEYGNCPGAAPKIIASQRSLIGPSFEEVPGYPATALSTAYNWAWYDEQSPGSLDWLMIVNPCETPVTYQVKISGVLQATSVSNPGTIPAHGQVTASFPREMGGPVELTSSGGAVIASQRVLWNGYFNEVLGTVLN